MYQTNIAKLITAAALGGMLSACSDTASSSLTFAVNTYFRGLPDVPVTPDVVTSSPYAMLYTKLGKGPRSILVLGQLTGDDAFWISADERSLVTKHGRLVATARFPSNIKATSWPADSPDPLANAPHQLVGTTRYTRFIDVDFDPMFSLPVTASLVPDGRETISIVGFKYDTVRLVETNAVPLLDWQWENVFWIDVHTGRVVKSRQAATPFMPLFDIEVLKPFAT